MSDADRQGRLACFLRKLESLAELSTADRDVINGLDVSIEQAAAGDHLIREGDRPTAFHVILDGFACRYKSGPDGMRQVLSFQTPGDIVDLQSLYLETMDYGVSTIVPTTVGRIPRGTLQTLARNHPAIARAFWRDTLVDAAIYREWMVGLGRRSARSHLAHLLCEVAARLGAVVPVPPAGADPTIIPLTRSDLADSLGSTVVEVNRQLFALDAEGLVALGAAEVTILDLAELARISDFDPTYLHQDRSA